MTASEPPDAQRRLAHVAADTIEHLWTRLAPKRAEMRDAAISEWLEGHEAEAVAIAGPFLKELAADETIPAHVRDVFTLMAEPEHQTQAVLTLLGVYPIISAFVMAAVQPFVNDIAIKAWSGHPTLPLTPQEIALGKLRNTPTGIDLNSEAAASGIDSERLDFLEYITGEPPGLMQLLEAFRRGFIDEGTLHRGVLQSRVRDEWFPTVLALRYAPPSPLEAVAGAVKGHLSDADAEAIAQEGGLDPKHYGWIRATAGRPPGAEGLMQLVNRGVIDEETFAEGIRQSDIQDRWIPELLALRKYLPPPRSIVSMLHHGAITDDDARRLLADHGVQGSDIDIYIAEGHASRTESVKHLALGEVSNLYFAGMVTRAEAAVDVQALGYNADQAEAILNLVDIRRQRRFTEAAVNRVHTLYTGHHIPQSDASNDLDKLGIKPEERDALLRLWTLEMQSNVKNLTLAQVQGAWRRTVIDTPTATGLLVELGYPAALVPALLALALPPSSFPSRTAQDVP